MGTDLLTSPAYMSVPGNIYHTVLCGSGDGHTAAQARELQPRPDTARRAMELKAAGVFLVLGVAIAVAWLVFMHREGY